MAEKLKERQSKIPRYVRTTTPVLSAGYLNVLKEIKTKRVEIEVKERKIDNLKNSLRDLNIREDPKEHDTTLAPSTTCSNRSAQAGQRNANASPSEFVGSQVRSTICTPGGTKRKVRLAYLKYQATLKDSLDKILVKETGQEVLVDDLLHSLRLHYHPASTTNRPQLLKEISKILGTTVEFRGKGRKLALYKNHRLVNEPTGPGSPSVSSPPCQKSRKDPPRSERVRTRLFTTTDEPEASYSEPSLQSMLDALNIQEKTELPHDQAMLKEQFLKLQDALTNTKHFVATLNERMEHLDADKSELQERLNSLETMFSTYKEKVTSIVKEQDNVITLYKDLLEQGNLIGGMLSISERQCIQSEIKTVKHIFDLGIRGKEKAKDLIQFLDPSLFQNLLVQVKSQCPMLVNILEQLVLSSNAVRSIKKTPNMKMKAAIHLLASILDVRDQNARNDIPILFGLLCLSFGAGPSLITVLQHLGLSESHPVLISVLRNQLEHYKTIISSRVASNHPVITYQDNMQIMRTSLRHLRLSKLHKEKLKQEKIWDFTVRGWRAADTNGIEDYFKDPNTAVEPQGEVSTMKYEDTKLDNNPEHKKLWEEFKERNLLRKMDVAFNLVPFTIDELKNKTSTDIRSIAENDADDDKTKKFVIDVPPLKQEFPELACQKSHVYSLPLSFENQCTTMGTANNLSLFSEEFNFPCKPAEKYIPMRQNAANFNLEAAYERYAFLKSLDKHKEKQCRYENILRKRGVESADKDNVQVPDNTIIGVLDSDSDSDNFSD